MGVYVQTNEVHRLREVAETRNPGPRDRSDDAVGHLADTTGVVSDVQVAGCVRGDAVWLELCGSAQAVVAQVRSHSAGFKHANLNGAGASERHPGSEAMRHSLCPELLQGRPFMHGNVVRLIAFDFVLRLVLGGMMRVALVIDILRMDLDDPAADVSRLGIPGHAIADFEAFPHGLTEKTRSFGPVLIKYSVYSFGRWFSPGPSARSPAPFRAASAGRLPVLHPTA
jgi:hypothetical protein